MAEAGAPSPSALSEEARAICRRYEPDRYIAALLAPREARDDLLAVAAFSGELLRVYDTAREVTIGLIRLQWWNDALQQLARGENSGHPSADALGRAMRRRRLPLDLAGELVEARMAELEGWEPRDDAALARDLGQSEGALIRLALGVLGVPTSPQAEDAVARAAVAYGITRLLMRLPVGRRRPGNAGIPADRLEAAGFSNGLGEVAASTPSFAAVLADLRAGARAALADARPHIAALGRGALPAFLPLVMVEPYLRVQERSDFDPLNDLAEVIPLLRVWRMWRAHRRGRI